MDAGACGPHRVLGPRSEAAVEGLRQPHRYRGVPHVCAQGDRLGRIGHSPFYPPATTEARAERRARRPVLLRRRVGGRAAAFSTVRRLRSLRHVTVAGGGCGRARPGRLGVERFGGGGGDGRLPFAVLLAQRIDVGQKTFLSLWNGSLNPWVEFQCQQLMDCSISEKEGKGNQLSDLFRIFSCGQVRRIYSLSKHGISYFLTSAHGLHCHAFSVSKTIQSQATSAIFYLAHFGQAVLNIFRVEP